jgi:hypothetical protein
LHDEIVDAHGDQVDADRAMTARLDGDLQLGADAIGGDDQQGILETSGAWIAERAEAAQGRIGPRSRGGARQGRDGLDQGIAGIDVDAGIFVGRTVANGLSRSPLSAKVWNWPGK